MIRHCPLFSLVAGTIATIAILFPARDSKADGTGTDSDLVAGASSVSILPKEPVQLGGYGLRADKSQGVRSDIFARALYVQKGEVRLIWIVCDVIGFETEDVVRIQKELAKQYNLPEENIIVSATHTHSAPNTTNGMCPDKAVKYMEETLFPSINQAASQAVDRAESCRMVTVQGECTIMHDRRNAPVAGDGVAPNPDPGLACVDTRVPVVGFKRDNGSFIAILAQFTAHPTSWGDLNIGSEWPGATALAIKKVFGENVEGFVLQGGAGNVSSPRRRAPQEEIQSWGDTIVASFTDQLQNAVPDDETVQYFSRTIPVATPVVTPDEVHRRADAYRKEFEKLPCVVAKVIPYFESELLKRIEKGTIDHFDSPTSFVALGRHVFVTVPYEAFSQMNGEIAKYTDRNVHVVGYTNGYFMYLPSKQAFEQGGYEPIGYLWFGNLGTVPGAMEEYAKTIGELLNQETK